MYNKEAKGALYVSDELTYEEVKRNLCFRAVNAEHNRQLLSDLPHVRLEDLAAVFLYLPQPCGEISEQWGAARGQTSWNPGPEEEAAEHTGEPGPEEEAAEHTGEPGPEEEAAERTGEPGPEEEAAERTGESGPEPSILPGNADAVRQEEAVSFPGSALKEDAVRPALCYPHRERLIFWQDVKRWDISYGDLLRDAASSSGRMHPAFFAPLRRILGLTDDPAGDEIPLYVLSCTDARYGASVLFYPEVIPRIARSLNDDLYVIPSSVHELLILRASDVDDPRSLVDIIREVNRTEVAPEEVLSDSLYVYSRFGDTPSAKPFYNFPC